MLDSTLVKRVYHLVRPYRKLLAVAMFCTMVAGALQPVLAYMLKPLIDKIFFEKNTMLLNLLPLGLVGLAFAKGFFTFWSTFLLDKVGQRTVTDIRTKIFTHIHSLHISYFYKTPVGELISRVIADANLIQGAVSHSLVSLLRDAFSIVGLVGLVLYLDWHLALLSVVFLPASVIPIVIFGKKHRRLSTRSQQTTAELSNIMHESITGNRIVKAFGMEAYEIDRFANKVEYLFSVTLKDAAIKAFSSPLMELLGIVGVALIAWYSGQKVLVGDSTPGTFFSFIGALIMLYEPIKRVSGMNSTVQQGIAAAQRVFNLLDVQPAIVDRPDAPDLPPLRERIELKNVSFSYDGQVPVLDNINLTVKTGEIIALVGPSGGGKTTLANLIPRFFDVSQGAIEIDGHDIRAVTVRSLRAQIAMVTQQTILFNDTIRNNIAYGDPQRSDAEILAAAKAAHAMEFIERLPDGINSIIGESGAKLSGGQRQRLSIARALLKDAPILVLDEATSALDTESERQVQKALENLMRDRTTFVIAHRLSTIRNADRILVLKAGKIVEQGTHESLLNANGVYKSLHNMQHSD